MDQHFIKLPDAGKGGFAFINMNHIVSFRQLGIDQVEIYLVNKEVTRAKIAIENFEKIMADFIYKKEQG